MNYILLFYQSISDISYKHMIIFTQGYIWHEHLQWKTHKKFP